MPPQTPEHRAKLSAAMKSYHKNFCNTEGSAYDGPPPRKRAPPKEKKETPKKTPKNTPKKTPKKTPKETPKDDLTDYQKEQNSLISKLTTNVLQDDKEEIDLSEDVVKQFEKIIGQEGFDILLDIVGQETEDFPGPWGDKESFLEIRKELEKSFTKIIVAPAKVRTELFKDEGAKEFVKEAKQKLKLFNDSYTIFKKVKKPDKEQIEKLKKSEKIIYP